MTDIELCIALGLDPRTTTGEQLDKEIYRRGLMPKYQPVTDNRLIMTCDCCCWNCCVHHLDRMGES